MTILRLRNGIEYEIEPDNLINETKIAINGMNDFVKLHDTFTDENLKSFELLVDGEVQVRYKNYSCATYSMADGFAILELVPIGTEEKPSVIIETTPDDWSYVGKILLGEL